MMKLAGAKTEEEFYKMFPTEEAFMAKHGKKIKKIMKANPGATIPPGDDFNGGQLNDIQVPYETFPNSMDRYINVAGPHNGMYVTQDNAQFLPGFLLGEGIGKSQTTREWASPVLMDPLIPENKMSAPVARNSGRTPNLGIGSSGSSSGNVMNYLGAATDVVKGLSMISQQKKELANAHRYAELSGVQLQASQLTPEAIERKYLRPEDMRQPLDAFINPLGTGTEVLAKKGKKIKKGGNGLLSKVNNLSPETIDQSQQLFDNMGTMIANGGTPDAGSTIGGGLGNAVGTYFGGPLGGMVGKFAGQIIGGAIDNTDKKIDKYNSQATTNMEKIMGANMIGALRTKNGGFMKDGGSITGDELQVYKGSATSISDNPYTGETIMFNGPSHEEGGMPIQYGRTPVEVEGGEPATKDREDNLVVFGDIKITKPLADILGDPQAKGKKFKSYVAEIAKLEDKQNKISERSIMKAADKDPLDRYDKLSLNSFRANVLGTDMKLKELAEKKDRVTALQSAIDEVASAGGFDSKSLIEKGQFKPINDNMANGGKISEAEKRRKNQYYEKSYKMYQDYLNDNNLYDRGLLPPSLSYDEFMSRVYKQGVDAAWSPRFKQWYDNSTNKGDYPAIKRTQTAPVTPIIPVAPVAAQSKSSTSTRSTSTTSKKKQTSTPPASPVMVNLPIKEQDIIDEPLNIQPLNLNMNTVPTDEKTDWFRTGANVLNSVLPYLRPSDAGRLDPRNVMGEMYALSNNQVEPVQAQTYKPQLTTPYDISLQDMMNEHRGTFRAMERLSANNPAALANLSAQRYNAEQKVLGEQFRINQNQKNATYNKNIDVMNAAQLQNLGILDQQMTRQETAKSVGKETVQNALNSISSKYLQNELENRTLKAYENLYNYRFGSDMRADNFNPLALFDLESQDYEPNVAPGREPLYVKTPTGEYELYNTTTKKKQTHNNGGLIKALKK